LGAATKTFLALFISGTVLATLGCSGGSSSRSDAGSDGSIGTGGAASGGSVGTGGAAGASGVAGHAGTGGGAGQAGATGGLGGVGGVGTVGGAGGHGGVTALGGAGGHGGVTALGGAGGHGGGGGAGAAAGRGGMAGSSPDGGPVCSAPDPVLDGGVRCGSSSLCDPPHPDGGVCNSVPPTNAATTSFTIWVDDSTAPGGGWRVTLAASTPVTAGGHSYQDMGEGLVGTGGNGIFGDLYVARDGQAKWTGFHLEGWPLFHGGGVWEWPATLTVSRAGVAAPAVVGRHYTISRAAPTCPGGNSATYTFAAEEPARACAFGVDLLSITFPGS